MAHHYGTRTQTRAAASTARGPTEEENLQEMPHPSLNELEGSLSNTPERGQLDSLDIIMEEGRRLGFEGAELRQYVIEERRFLIKRESERQEAERKERREEREAERKERERREEREHELARLRLQAETGSNRNNNAPTKLESKTASDREYPISRTRTTWRRGSSNTSIIAWS